MQIGKGGFLSSLNNRSSGIYGEIMFLYFLRAGNRGAIKIGIAKDVKKRIDELQVGNAFQLNLLATIPCDCRDQALELERRIHAFFKRQRIRGEWFQGNIQMSKINELKNRGCYEFKANGQE